MSHHSISGLLAALVGAASVSADTWTDYSEIGPTFADYEALYPDLCKRYDLGLSVEGRHLWALRISDNVSVEEDEPEFKYISTMHGDEIVGTKMLMMLIEHLIDNYGSDPQATTIIDEVELWIVPLMNPDGYDHVPRYRENANGVDLNRNFPNYGEPNSTEGREPETAIIMNWSTEHMFTCSANMHTGSLVVNYPFDNDDTGSQYSPDDDLFIYISKQYSMYNPPMWDSPYFPFGITNGADWYYIWGGMQDWNYHFMGNNEVTIELSDIKEPSSSLIPQYWSDNRDSMLAYIETCLIGVRGLVNDALTGEPVETTIVVLGRDHEIYTDGDVGDYHRMLLPGSYDFRFDAEGYDPLIVDDITVYEGPATILDVVLYPAPDVTAPDGGESLPVDVPTLVTWVGNPAARFHIQSTANFGDLELVADDFESGTLGDAYDTGGDADWYVTTGESHGGAYAARAGDIGHSDVTWMTRTAGEGELSFWYRVSSEADYDFFNFSIDGKQKIHASGTGAGWQLYSTTLGPGSHELRWEYKKDSGWTSGQDTAWIDELAITEDLTQWSDIVDLTALGAMSVEWTPGEESDACKVRVRAYYEDGDYYGLWGESDDVFAVVEGSCAADLTGDGMVDVLDLLAVLGAWGPCPGCAEDITGDDVVDVLDLLQVLSAWGACP